MPRAGVEVNTMTGPIYPWERPSTHCIGGWVGPSAGLDRFGKSSPTGIRSYNAPHNFESKHLKKKDVSLCQVFVTANL
jgi:hypothetical protein